MSLGRSVFAIGSFTLLSRVLGFVRDMMIAAQLGTSMLADAFFVAFKIPNFFRRIFSEGAFSAAFVPLFAGKLAAESREEAKKFAEEAFAFLFFTLLAFTALLEICMPWWVYVMAPGFVDEPEKYNYTVLFSRITFPYLLLISLTALLGGIMNSLEKFWVFAAAPALMNLCLIFGPILLAPVTPSESHGLAISVTASGVLQLSWLAWHVRKEGMLPRLRPPQLTPGVKKLLKLMVPAAIGASVAQINLVVDVMLASLFTGAVSYLYFADRVNELPLGVIGIAIGTVLLPRLSKQMREGKHDEARTSLNRALEMGLLFSVPACAALIVLAEPIARVLFERGAFTPQATAATAGAIIAYALGLPAFVMVKVFAPGFFAAENTKTPVKIAILCLGVHLVLNLILMWPLEHVGLALATSIAGWLNAGLLAHKLKEREAFLPDVRLKKRAWRMVLASGAMAGVAAGLAWWARPWLAGGEALRIPALAGVVAAGGVTYLALGLKLGAMDWQETKSYLRRKKG